jgi:hypothetical protein
MTRYYFDLLDNLTTRDEEGRELPGLDEAILLAQQIAREMAAVSVQQGRLRLGDRIEVRELDGRISARVRFGDVVEVED